MIMIAIIQFIVITVIVTKYTVVGYYTEKPILTFLCLGDWGKGGISAVHSTTSTSYYLRSNVVNSVQASEELYQRDVAIAMGTYSKQNYSKPEFIVALGDNFYVNGVQSSTDSLWDSLWKEVYLDFDDLNIPWYPVFGNHDYGYGESGVQAQLVRYKEHNDDDIWMFEAKNYTKLYQITNKNIENTSLNIRKDIYSQSMTDGTVRIVYIDTTTLAPSVNKCCNEKGGISTDEQARRIKDQLYHINKMLYEASLEKPSWLIVAGHYPIYSAGDQGDVSELILYLLPLLEKYHVDVYLCGHDHVGQHLQHPNYSTVGAGTMITQYSKSTSNANVAYFGAGYASFAVINTSIDTMNISFIDTTNTIRYHYTMHKEMISLPRIPIEPSLQPTSNITTTNNNTNIIISDTDDNYQQPSIISNFIESNEGRYIIASFSFAFLFILLLFSYSTCYTSRNKNIDNIKSIIDNESRKPNMIQNLKINKKNYHKILEEHSQNDLEIFQQQETEEIEEVVEDNQVIEGNLYELRSSTRSMITSPTSTSSASSLSIDSLEQLQKSNYRVVKTMRSFPINESNPNNYRLTSNMTTRARAVTYSV